MLRKSNSSSSSSGGAGGLGTKHVQDLPQHKANPHPKSLSPRSTKAWTMGRSTRNPNPLSTMGLSSRLMGAPGVDADYVMQLVNDVRWFADVLLNLKDAFQEKENLEGLQDLVKERLAELIRVLKTVISKHQTLNSVDILGAAGMVIAKVKGINFKEVNPENKQAKFGEIHTSIDILAFTFGNVVSDFLMGDVDSSSGLGIPQTRRSRSFDNLSVDPEGYVLDGSRLVEPELSRSREEEVDLTLLKNDSGVESALLYAKAWSKYIKDLLGWMEKRAAMDIDYAKSYTKMAETAKTLASQQDYMPFSDVYVSTFKRDIDYNQLLIHTAVALQTNKFMQPLLARKNELDKLRKDMKEQWQREQKKMQEADTTLRKARALNTQRREEYQRAHSSKNRSMEEQPIAGNKQMEKKRKLEEEALQKAEEAQDQYQSCVADTDVRKMDLANVKRTILTQIREMVFQCDLTLKAVTVNWFQMQQAQTLALPDHFQALSESTKLYEPGGCYAKFVQNLPRNLPVEHLRSHSSSDFSRFVLSKKSQGSAYSSHGNLSQASATSCDVPSGDDVDRPAKIGERRSNSSVDITAALRSQGPLRAWASSSQGSQGGMCSDSESAGGSSESRSMDSPTASPGDFKRRLPRTPSTGTMSSADDLDEREPLSPLDNGLTEMVIETASSPGPFRNTQLSKAAQTHKLRKLRAPSKCRECDSLVVFHGAECEECTLACHKKCLETLAIQCGHKKLQGRLQLFGIDFAQAAKNSPDGIPFIIKKCTSEIESRALNIKGIYRVNGAKLRVEKLCQAFENGKDLVELSDLSPHDISNVLKLYLRQLPEPLITFRFYNNFIGLAKECQRVVVEEAVKHQGTQTKEKTSPSIQMSTVLSKIRELLHQLPAANYRTLRHIIAHLNRVTEQAEENKMTASNLGIIFGPTMVKPRQIDAEVSLSSLVDYPYQVLMVEQLVRHFHTIFDDGSNMATSGHASPRLTPQEKVQQLGRHSASLTDIKESSKAYKRFSSVIPSSHILSEVQEVRPGRDTTEPSTSEKLNGVQAPGAEGQRSTSNIPTIDTEPKVQMRNQRGRQCSRPISMPLERLPAPAQISERNNRNASDKADGGFPQRETETIQEMPEPERARQTGSSRISTYYITPFIDTQAMQRRTWDKKYKHYHVTPRTAMIVANLPPVNAGLQPVKATVPAFPAVTTTPVVPTTSSVTTMFSNNTMSLKPVRTSKREKDTESSEDESGNSPKLPLTLRPPRTLHPSPETFYRPPLSSNSKAWSLPTRTTTTATTSPPSPTTLLRSLSPTNPTQALHQTQDSTDSAIDPGVLTSTTISPSQSPPPSSPDDLSPTEVKPRLRSRPLQDHEQREAHFV
ncbi:rho GTPase-activating protein 29 isoform X1 [Nothobranchius furzeri]|uniref:Rho GTPase-activating protein 29 n=2 Tax=Nothobranchius furzeri TaxID=105023 RepID=A0A1A8AX81_NOTFU|nr:rho GTPase-activating protein 29 isoform X1 [Nothobranchius furzeri]XP_015811763.1 rho GTPase-activating protein 29 isoform X1 [Nothobranchius furzeri]KAF7222135.1 transcript variant X1 [Nothobranchius furzeri]KAF7222136.1 transcript variant X2 [Nothobranchius furzeri]